MSDSDEEDPWSNDDDEEDPWSSDDDEEDPWSSDDDVQDEPPTAEPPEKKLDLADVLFNAKSEELFGSASFIKYREQILNRTTSIRGNSQVLNWTRNRNLSSIEKGVLAEFSYEVLRGAESSKEWLFIKSYYKQYVAQALNPGVKFHPLYAAKVYNQLATSRLNVNFFVPFPPNLYTAFVRSWMDELDENEDAWVPKQPVLLFSFLMDENNAGVILPKLVPILASMRSGYASFTEKQYKPINMKNVRENGPWRENKETDIVQLAVDKTQGLRLSDYGNTLLTILVGIIVEMGRNGGPLEKGLKLNTSSFEIMFSQAYVYLCTAQENYLKQKSQRLLGNPYTFTDWSLTDASKPRFPMLYNKVPQSLAHLNIRKNVEQQQQRPECSACQKGYITFYGNSWFKGKAEKQPVKLDKNGNYVSGGNSEAQCIQQLDDLLKTAGVKMNSKNPWYVDFVGTWQQAQKRLDDFKKKQSELYDVGDPRYDWVDYYYKWIILKVDVAIKKFADISDAKEGQEALIGEALDALEDTGIFAKLKSWAGKLIQLGAFSALIAYKIISLVLVSPMTQELLIQFCKHIKESICQRIAIETGKAVLVREKERDPSKGAKREFEEFDEKTGKWFAASAENQKKYAQEEQQRRNNWWKDMAFRFFDTISSGTMLNGWMKTLADMGTMVFGAVGQGINWLIGWLEKIPVIGGVIGAIGGTGVIAPIVIAYLQKEARSSWNEMVTLNRRFTQLKKLYQAMFSGWSDCLTLMDSEDPTSGKLIVKDGGALGQTTYFKEAFYHAQFNIPYYAILVLNELAYREENPKPKKPADIDAIIESLIRTEFVAGSKAQKKLAEKALESQKNMKILKEKLKTMTEEEAKQELQEEIDAKKAWEEKKKWLGYAALSAAAFMASGGTSGLLQAAAAVGGAASTAAATAASAVGGASLASAAATAKTAMDYAKEYPEETAMMGTLFGMGGYKFYEKISHLNDAYKIVTVQDALNQAGVRKMLFHSKLRDKIDEFKVEVSKLREPAPVPMRIAPWEVFEVIMKSKSGFYVYEWAKKSYINYERANEFFKSYGSPHVDISKEKNSKEPPIHKNNWGERRRRAAAAKARANSTSSNLRSVFRTKWLPKNKAGVRRQRRTLFVL